MTAGLQTVVTLVLVALAAAFLVRSLFHRRQHPGCGNNPCGAVSPEMRKLRRRSNT